MFYIPSAVIAMKQFPKIMWVECTPSKSSFLPIYSQDKTVVAKLYQGVRDVRRFRSCFYGKFRNSGRQKNITGIPLRFGCMEKSEQHSIMLL